MAESVYGFVCDSLAAQDAIQPNDIGQSLTTDVKPWLVHPDVATLYIKQWPVQLWFVEVVKAFSSSHGEAIPAVTIKPLKQLPCSLLFGPKGDGICQLLNKVMALTLEQVEQLARLANPISEEVYAKAWNNWLQQSDNSTMHYDTDHTGTLAIGEGENASPIYHGFLTLSDLFHAKATELVGDEAFIKPLVAADEVYLSPLWNKACSVLLQSAMGLGAEQYIHCKELPLLLLGWQALNTI